jgi:hypothetical protein
MNIAHHMTLFLALAGTIIAAISAMILLRADHQQSLMLFVASLMIAAILGIGLWLERQQLST